MIVKLMSLFDILTAVVMILYQFGSVSFRLLLSFTAYLLIKFFMFRGDFASFIDLCIAIYMLFMLVFPIPLITWIAAIYLIQKAVSGFIL